MRLKINDFKNIESADIILDGITVICGENGTGKSNIIKAANAIGLSSFYFNKGIVKDSMEAFKRGFHNIFKCGSYVKDKLSAFITVENNEQIDIGCAIRDNKFYNVFIDNNFSSNFLLYDKQDINYSKLMGQSGNSDYRKIDYKSEKLDNLLSNIDIEKNLDYPDLPAGILPFAHIKKLLNYSNLNKGDTILIDDAEKNLHPKWQISFAIVLYEFMKATGVNVLLSTHSPYMVESIELIDPNAHFYFIENKRCNDVKEDSWKIYYGMATPLKAVEKGVNAIYESFASPIEDFSNKVN